MLTAKQNMIECIKGGNPDRFVNQYEAIRLLFHPFMFASPLLQEGQENVKNAWGVTQSFPRELPERSRYILPIRSCKGYRALERLCTRSFAGFLAGAVGSVQGDV